MRFDGKTNPQRAVTLTLTKLSNVEAPAHTPALARIIKSQDVKEVFKLLFNDALGDIQMRDTLRGILRHYRALEEAMRESIMETLNDEEVPNKRNAIFTSLIQFITALQELVDSDLFEGAESVIQMQKQKDDEEDERMRREGRSRGRRQTRRGVMRKVALELVFKSFTGEFKEGGPLIKNCEISHEAMIKAVEKWDKEHKDFVNEFFKTEKQEESNVSKELEAKVAKMEADLRKSNILAGLSDDQKNVLSKMSDVDQESFYKEEDSEARADMLKAKEQEINKAAANDESFTMGGETIVKSEVGAGIFTMLKAQSIQLAAAEESLKKEKEARMDKEYEERAAKRWPNLKGTDAEKGQMLKDIETLPESVQKSRLEMMDSANESSATMFKENGHGYTTMLKGEEKLDAMAKTIQSENPGLSYEKAYVQALKSDEGDQIYKSLN